MGRIPEAEVERLKSEVSIQRLAESRGIVLRTRGDELIGLCPFHDDHSPSLVINPKKNLWHCLGACQTGGSVIDWVMKAEGVSFRHAVELLRKDVLSLPDDTSPKPVKKTSKTKLNVLIDGDAETQGQLGQVINYYHETLKQSPEALSSLEQRGIASPEAIDTFKLGYANRTLGYHLPNKQRKAGAEIRGQLEEIGIYRTSGHEHFSGSLVIPVFNEAGEVSEVYGRKILSSLRKGTPLHLYLPGPHRGVWNVDALKTHKEIILCESLIDALTFWCAGYRNVTASYGIEGFTDEHREAFEKYDIERVLIAYDRDDAGEKASSSLAAELMSQGIECFRVQFPRGMDANEYALQVTPEEKSLGIAVRNSVWLGKGRSPKISTPAVSIETDRQATKGGKDGSECRAVVNLPPCPVEAERPEINTGPTSENAPPSTPMPTPATSTIKADIKPNEITIPIGDRRWRIRGLEKNMAFDVMKVNVLVGKGDGFYVDTFDLYAARHRQAFLKQASDELSLKEDVLKKDLGKVLLKLEELQEKQINDTLKVNKDRGVMLSESERTAAMALLKDPNILDRILNDFEKCGIVGEETNKLVGYLAAVSRKLEEPLAVVIQSSSAAGKSSLMEAILSFLPHEEQVKYSAMTGQSLFYMGETDLQHKILAIVEEEGAERASYALKLLQSEGELAIASTGKDPSTGRLVTQEYRVEGPVMIFQTTTAIEIDEELLNRCIVLTVDEDREQTRAIHRLQRERQTLEGLLARQDRSSIMKLHQDTQRLLRPLLVANPYARELTFLDNQTRTRRDHMKYLTLIRAIALLHQYQRPTKHIEHQGRSVPYIEVTLDDIEIANRLSHQVLGRSLDELSPQTRRLLMLLDRMVTEQCRKLELERCDYVFARREVREHTGFGLTQTRIHLDRLVDLEYVLVHRGGRGQSFVYELMYDGKSDDDTHLNGLIDVEAIRNEGMTQTWRGKTETWRGHDGPKTEGWRGVDRQVSVNDLGELPPINGKSLKNAHLDERKKQLIVDVIEESY